MIDPQHVACVIPTRCDRDLTRLLEHVRAVPFGQQLVVASTSVYGRYELAQMAGPSWIYTQDDDCLPDIAKLLGEVDAGRCDVLTHFMTPEHAPQYPGRVSLVGFGAVFHRSLLRLLDGWDRDALFLRECDRVFTALALRKQISAEVPQLEYATEETRLYRQIGHVSARQTIEARIRLYLKSRGVRD